MDVQQKLVWRRHDLARVSVFGSDQIFLDLFQLAEDGITGRGTLLVTHEHCAGHFKDGPLLFPGHLMLEAAVQTAYFLNVAFLPEDKRTGLAPLFAGVGGMTLHLPVFPRDTIVFEVTPSSTYIVDCCIFRGSDMVAQVMQIRGAVFPRRVVERLLSRQSSSAIR